MVAAMFMMPTYVEAHLAPSSTLITTSDLPQPRPSLVPQAQEPTAGGCLSERPPHFYHGDVPDGTHWFGPAVNTAGSDQATIDRQAYAEFLHRLCGNDEIGGDPQLLAAIRAVIYGSDPNYQFTRREWRTRLNQLVLSIDAVRTVVVTLPFKPGETTMRMIGMPPVVSTVPYTDRGLSRFLALRVMTPAGWTTFFLRLGCGFQPVQGEQGAMT